MPDNNKNNIDNEDLQNDINDENSKEPLKDKGSKENPSDNQPEKDDTGENSGSQQDDVNEINEQDQESLDHTENMENLTEEEEPETDLKKSEEVPGSEEKVTEEIKPEETLLPEIGISRKKPSESNYQISLVNENLLKIKISTDREVEIGYNISDVENRKIVIDQSGSNKKKDIELVVSISPDKKPILVTDTLKDVEGETNISGAKANESGSNVILPVKESPEFKWERNDAAFSEEKTPEQILYEKLEKKNPYVLFRRIYQRNFTQATAGAIVIYLIAVALFGAYATNLKTPQVEPEQRLVIIQDMPEPKINLQNVEDPNAPPPEEESEDDGLIPRKITRNSPPRIYRPKTDDNTPPLTVDTNDLANKERELDSLRNLENDSNKKINNNVPDSGLVSMSVDDIGLSIDFPNGWGLTDTRSIDKNLKGFKSAYLADSNANPVGAMALYFSLDNNNEKYSSSIFTERFNVRDTTITAFTTKPEFKPEGIVEMKFYIFGKTDKLYVNGLINESQLEKYRPLIEDVVRSIRLSRKGP